MKQKFSFALCAFLLAAGTASADQPAIASAWGDTRLAKEACVARGVATLQRHNFTRVEGIDHTAYGDLGNIQVGIRCLTDKNIIFLFGGGPGDQDKKLIDLLDTLKASFQQ
jgi:hypothetical protein